MISRKVKLLSVFLGVFVLASYAQWDSPGKFNLDNLANEYNNILTPAPSKFPDISKFVSKPFLTEESKKIIAEIRPGDWTDLISYIDRRTNTSSSGKNYIKFLIDGEEFLPELINAFENAKKHIHIEIFNFQPDEVGKNIAKILSKKARSGVKVRIVIDGLGGNIFKPSVKNMIANMRSSGVDIRIRPIPFLAKHLDHRKVIVIDGEIGFTGGMNLAEIMETHDQQALIKGPAVYKLQESFVEHWKAVKGTFSPDENLFPELKEIPDGYETRVVAHKGWVDKNIKLVYIAAIATATKSIKIANPYFTDKDVIESLCLAAKRGVKVDVVLPKKNNEPLVQFASRSLYPKLIKAGVNVYEYKVRVAHEKVAVMDGRFVTFGSSNLDERSLKNNDELNLVIDDYRLAQEIETRLFETDLKNSELINNYSPSIIEHIIGSFSDYLSNPISNPIDK